MARSVDEAESLVEEADFQNACFNVGTGALAGNPACIEL